MTRRRGGGRCGCYRDYPGRDQCPYCSVAPEPEPTPVTGGPWTIRVCPDDLTGGYSPCKRDCGLSVEVEVVPLRRVTELEELLWGALEWIDTAREAEYAPNEPPPHPGLEKIRAALGVV